MKRISWIVLLLFILTGLLVACGGGAEAPAEPVETNEVQDNATSEEPAVEEPVSQEVEPSTDETSNEETAPAAEEEAPVEESAASGDMVAGRPASGIDPDTGMEINPPEVVPGVEFIVRGEIVNASLTPQENPEFVVLAPSGTRYRIFAQNVNDISYEDGTKPALHEFARGMTVQATVRQDEDAGATIAVNSSDFTLLHDQ